MTNQIDQFFNPDGTLISIPVKSAKKIAVLLHIARDLSHGILERDGESVYWLRSSVQLQY